jgi:hypothetical protein
MSIFRRKSKPEEKPPTDRVAELANRLAAAGRADELEQELAGFDPRTLTEAERESWHHLRGIAAFRRGEHEMARTRFAEGLAAFPRSGTMAFSLGQEYEHVGDVAQMLALFDQFRFPAVPARFALAQARYAYLWGAPEKALDYALPIRDAYHALGIVDDTFLHIRGLPFYSETWAYLAAFHELLGTLGELETLTEADAKQLKDYDFDRHRAFLGCVRANDVSPVARRLRESIAGADRQGIPSGYSLMRAAILESLVASPPAADSILDEVQLSPRDFPWLDDIRLLARCAAAARAGDHEYEAKLQDQFLRRQPRLFEPDHAFDFRLLGYQERLKPRYQVDHRVH